MWHHQIQRAGLGTSHHLGKASRCPRSTVASSRRPKVVGWINANQIDRATIFHHTNRNMVIVRSLGFDGVNFFGRQYAESHLASKRGRRDTLLQQVRAKLVLVSILRSLMNNHPTYLLSSVQLSVRWVARMFSQGAGRAAAYTIP